MQSRSRRRPPRPPDRDPVEIYRDVLSGRLRQFPPGMWTGPDALSAAAVVTRYMVEVLCRVAPQDAPQRISSADFKRWCLQGAFITLFRSSPAAALANAYPDAFHPWQLARPGFWHGSENRTLGPVATRWLVEEVLAAPVDEAPAYVQAEHFDRHGLGGMLDAIYKNSPAAALEDAYPGRFRPWALRRRGRWKGPEGLALFREAVRSFVAARTREGLADPPKRRDFAEAGLAWPLAVFCGGNVTLALKWAAAEVGNRSSPPKHQAADPH